MKSCVHTSPSPIYPIESFSFSCFYHYVSSARRLIESLCLNRPIEAVNVYEQGNGPRQGLFDEIVCENLTPDLLQKALLGRAIHRVHRKGKYLWFELSGNGRIPVYHFGMTGSFAVENVPGVEYKRITVDTTIWPPKFTKHEIIFGPPHVSSSSSSSSSSKTKGNDRVRLAFTDPRRLGRIKLVTEPYREPPLSELGWDAYTELIPLHNFFRQVNQRNGPIKAALLDQGWIAGIGNWIADEVLYQSKIHPESLCKALTNDDISQLYTSIRHVITTACTVNSDSSKFPATWLFHYRWGKVNSTLPDGKRIEYITAGGRTSAVIKQVQGTPKRTVIVETTTEAGSRSSSSTTTTTKPKVSRKRKQDTSNTTDIVETTTATTTVTSSTVTSTTTSTTEGMRVKRAKGKSKSSKT